ncbi:MAG: 2Fe-2S iron-sulfur cluster-binding protein, partial [Pseudomonadota bacterium]
MAYTATLNTINQKFVVHENETILEAAIRSGIPLNYGCSSGTCGLCQAKLTSGDAVEIRPHEYVISEADKLQGNILTCVCSLREHSVLEAVTAENITLQNIEVKVRKVEELAEDIYRVIVQTPRTRRLRFLAGQYVKLDIDGVGVMELSIASCPCEDRLIEFHLRNSKDGALKNAISQLRPSDTLELVGPYGGFIFDEEAGRPVILFAFDTGFAAIKSLLEHITAQESETTIHLIWMTCTN